jgi:hypothetical protein
VGNFGFHGVDQIRFCVLRGVTGDTLQDLKLAFFQGRDLFPLFFKLFLLFAQIVRLSLYCVGFSVKGVLLLLESVLLPLKFGSS